MLDLHQAVLDSGAVTFGLQADGLAMPVSDRECMAALKREVSDIETVLTYCRSFHVAVQAGGNIGVWPLHLASKFDTVYTFEPDSQNFACLAWNTRDCENVVRLQAALGEAQKLVGMNRTPENIGAHMVNGAGIIPMLSIDSLRLPHCDLIYLDIEGHEPQALMGARNTIARFHPVLSIEDKSLCDPQKREEALYMLQAMGYRMVAELHRDKIFVCSL